MKVASESVRDALARAGLLVAARGPMPPWLDGITSDSRTVLAGALFVAVRGIAQDGHAHLGAAASAGAIAAIVEDASRTDLPVFVVRDARSAAGVAAAVVYGFPGRSLRAIAVTGTNGKSTTVAILRHLFDAPDAPAASIGTIGVLVGSAGAELGDGSGLTTPGPIELQHTLRLLVDRGVRTVAIEASSHSLDQHRIDGLTFDAAVFTNLTRDHLDYHGTMDAYRAAKARLVTHLGPEGVIVVNADDPAWRELTGGARRVTFAGVIEPGAGGQADVRALAVRYEPRGTTWTLVAGKQRARVQLPLMGDFNVVNALGAAATAWALGMSPKQIAERLATLPQVPGRLERVHDAPTVLRDYAHTPDALARALTAVRPFTRGHLIVVFGAGGDRDRGKRPQMGAIAERLADIVVLTSDNPRTESPERIIDEIEAGMTRPHERVVEREDAIARALALAGPDDLVLLAGKGHETYQVRGVERVPFDEREIVHRILGPGRATPSAGSGARA